MARAKKSDMADGYELTETENGAFEENGAAAEELVPVSRVKELVAEAAAKAVAEALAQRGSAPAEMVTVLYLDEINQDATLTIPEYGSIRPMAYLEIPKKEFGNKFMSALVRRLIAARKLIVTDGLTKEERRRWNCDYREGEVMDMRVFDHMLDFSTEELAAVFENLCEDHQRLVACRMITAKEKGDNRVSVEKARRLNEISKRHDKDGMFRPVLQSAGKELSEA